MFSFCFFISGEGEVLACLRSTNVERRKIIPFSFFSKVLIALVVVNGEEGERGRPGRGEGFNFAEVR